ncbi:MAG: hypothetical protein ABI426_04265 [Flavobacterium sp.]
MKKLKYALSIIFMLAIASCSKDDSANNINTPEPNIYVAGWSTSNPSESHRATIWKNGAATFLTDGTKDATANSIFVNNNDVYVVGSELNEIRFWKNGVLQNLNVSTTNASSGIAVTVSNNNVYVLGSQSSGSGTIIKYWKNGVLTDVTTGTAIAFPTDIKVLNNDVYITYNEGDYAKLWKNGVVTNLSDGTLHEETISMAIDNNNVYVLGNQSAQVKYWKNGVETLAFPIGTSRGALGIDVSGGTVYIGGYDNYKPQTWVNGNAQSSNASTVGNGFITAVKMFNNNFYAVGNQTKSKLWINGSESILSPNSYSSDTYSIFLTN